MLRNRRPLIRQSANRDARLIIVAAEDTKATVAYFQTLTSPDYYQNSKVHVEILLSDDTNSAPEYILDQLKEWREEYQIGDDDELWLVIDVDRWGDKKLSRIAQECTQLQIRLAISNPAIELWFLLHWTDLDRYDQAERQALLANKKVNANRTRLEAALMTLAGEYNKSNFHARPYMRHAQTAIERAEKLDTQPQDRWPQGLGTRVYLLARSILDTASYKVG